MMMSIASMTAKTISAAIAKNNIILITGIEPIISPTVNANAIDKINMIASTQHPFFLCLQPV